MIYFLIYLVNEDFNFELFKITNNLVLIIYRKYYEPKLNINTLS